MAVSLPNRHFSLFFTSVLSDIKATHISEILKKGFYKPFYRAQVVFSASDKAKTYFTVPLG